MFIKNLLRRKARTLLTIAGICIGVAAMIGLGTMANGLQTGYNSMMAGSKADLILSQPNSFDITLSSVDESVGIELQDMPEVSATSGMLQGWSQTENEPFFFVFGYPQDSFVLGRYQIVDGVALGSREAQKAKGKPLLLGSSAAEVMSKEPGDTIRLMDSAFRIVGIYQTGDSFEDSGAVLGLADAQQVVGKPNQVSLFYIQLKDTELRERFIKRIERKLPDLSVSGADEFADEQIMDDMIGAYVWVIAGLAIIIGGVGMMNAQLMAVYERTREIGVLRALGWSRTRILWMFLGESITVGLFGGLFGIGFGWLMLYGLSRQSVFMGLVNTNLSVDLLVQTFVVVVILGIVGGLYPAWRASRLQVVEALRYEGGSSGGKVRRFPIGGMAAQSLWQRSMRTLLTLGVIGITVGSIVSLESIIGGMMDIMSGMFQDVEIMIRQADIADTSLSALDERMGDRLAAMSEVESASGVVFTAVMLPDTGGFFLVQGFSPNEYAIRRFRIVDGERLSGNHQIIIGRMMAESMNKKVGDTIELSGSRYRIVGVYESRVALEEMGGVMTLRDSQTLAGRPHKVTMYAVKLTDPSLANDLVEKINSQFPDGFAALSGEFAEQMPDFQSSEYMIDGISILAILVGGIGVLNTMLMAVIERTREIGVLRSLGWRRRSILSLILREAILLGLLGGVVGIGIAFGLNYAITLIPDYGSMIEPVWEWSAFIRAVGVALFLGLLGGLYPAYRATKLQPVEALRYE